MFKDFESFRGVISPETYNKLAQQEGRVFPPLLERFIVLDLWKGWREYKKFGISDENPDVMYLKQLIRDLVVVILSFIQEKNKDI
ncbi:MAG: hypothetical protein QXG16_04765 [Candidatus Anstonellaceae archaeon]